MRKDMAKVIVERPRSNRTWAVDNAISTKKYRVRNIEDREFENTYPSKIGFKRSARIGGHQKWLNENLNPLFRFLEKNAGRPWNKVYSEICANLSLESAIQRRVLEHLKDYVCMNVMVTPDGTYRFPRSSGPAVMLDEKGAPRMYVDPKNGLLCKNKSYGKQRRDDRQKEIQKQNELDAARQKFLKSTNKQFHKILDVWYEVELVLLPVHPNARIRDAILGTVIASKASNDLALQYGILGVYGLNKRQLDKRELKKYRLNS